MKTIFCCWLMALATLTQAVEICGKTLQTMWKIENRGEKILLIKSSIGHLPFCSNDSIIPANSNIKILWKNSEESLVLKTFTRMSSIVHFDYNKIPSAGKRGQLAGGIQQVDSFSIVKIPYTNLTKQIANYEIFDLKENRILGKGKVKW